MVYTTRSGGHGSISHFWLVFLFGYTPIGLVVTRGLGSASSPYAIRSSVIPPESATRLSFRCSARRTVLDPCAYAAQYGLGMMHIRRGAAGKEAA
jgi:hypothetical protein